MKGIPVFALGLISLHLGACKPSDFESGKTNLEDRIEQLEKEKAEALAMSEAAKLGELETVREQLQIALEALAAQQVTETESPAIPPIPDGGLNPTSVTEDNEAPLAKLALKEIDPVETVLGERDHQVFFVELAKFGEWFQTTDYGFVWKPDTITSDPDWRPYTRGRWMYSDQGWTWASDEPFGWAVYHYGRWAMLEDHGWVWIPGDDWAPAWVSWRQSDDHIGWSPLPPETLHHEVYNFDIGIDEVYSLAPESYSFVPISHFHEPVIDYCLPPATVVNIVIRTTNVTRIWTRDRRIHCGGPDFGWVNRHCLRPIPRCRLDLRHDRLRFARRNRHHFHDGCLEVFAPPVRAAWNPAVRPFAPCRNLGQVRRVMGTNRCDRRVVTRFQQAMVRRHQEASRVIRTNEVRTTLQRHQHNREAWQDRIAVTRRNTAIKEAGQQREIENARRVKQEKLAKERAEQIAAAERAALEKRRREAMQQARSEKERAEAEARHQAAQAEIERRRLAQLELQRQEQLKAQAAAAEREKQRLLAVQRAQDEAKKRAAEERAKALVAQKLAAQKRDAARVAAEKRAQAEAAQRARALQARKLEEQKREADIRAAQKRAAEDAAKRAAQLRAEGLRRKVEADTRAKAEMQRRAEEAGKRTAEEARKKAANDALKRQAAERAKNAALRARQEAEVRRRAEEAKKRAQMEAARQQALRQAKEAAQRRALEARKRAAIEAQKRAAAQRKAHEDVARRAAQKRAQEEAARRAAEKRAKEAAARRAAEKRAREEAARRAAEARARAEAAKRAAQKRAQEEAAKQKRK